VYIRGNLSSGFKKLSKGDLSVADNSVLINSGEKTLVVCDIGPANQVISSSSDIVNHSK